MEIKGPKKVDLTVHYLLDKISEYEIYRYYLGHDFKIGRSFNSPFRKETDASFSIIVTKGGRLHHTDFGDSTKRGDCIDFVQQLFPGLSYGETLSKIAHEFGLSKYSTSPQGERREVNLEPHITKETLIQVVTRPFTHSDISYWKQYGINETELKANEVYSVKKLYLNRERIMLPITDLVFGYLMEDKWKIYRPLADKKDKWMTNVPNSYISGMYRIKDGCENVVITKAKKDEMVLAKFLPYVLSVQSESEFCITKNNIDLLTNMCGSIYINFDSDEVGVQACKYYNKFGFKWINCPKGYKTPEGKAIKDFADLARYHGLQMVIEHFKNKRVIS